MRHGAWAHFWRGGKHSPVDGPHEQSGVRADIARIAMRHTVRRRVTAAEQPVIWVRGSGTDPAGTRFGCDW